MKVLFAVSNENISESIVKKYQQEYREIISSKNVYYFNAIIKELQKDKSYDRIVISEDLEPFSNNNYEVIDKFIFEKLDNISDEATSNDGTDIPIILICADRRSKSENLLVKLFGIGVYSALLGQDRSITNVCALMNKPRSKKDAKIYYQIDSENVDYKSENEGDVSEIEIQNILNHYKRLGKNEEKYVESFDSIAAQYTDAQLRVICKFLPLNVKAVLEASSQKYQELITFGTVTPSISVKGKSKYRPNNDYYNQRENNPAQQPQREIFEKNIGSSNLTRPVVIPSSMNSRANETNQPMPQQPMYGQPQNQPQMPQQPMYGQPQNQQPVYQQPTQPMQYAGEGKISDLKENRTTSSLGQDFKENEQTESIEAMIDMLQTAAGIDGQVKRKRGRPKKVQANQAPAEDTLPGFENIDTLQNPINSNNIQQVEEQSVKKKRGRPRKVQPVDTVQNIEEEAIMPGFEETPIINQQPINQPQTDANVFSLATDEETISPSSNSVSGTSGGIILPGFENEQPQQPSEQGFTPSMPQTNSNSYVPPSYSNYQQKYNTGNREIQNTNPYQISTSFNNLLTKDKKIVAFVGTSKNGISFLVNNLAEVLSNRGINTAILDLTKNKNAYYIYTQNEEELRKKSYDCISKLRNGIADGIPVNKNLTVYTTLPDQNVDINDYQNILATLAQQYSLVLMDCDYDTEFGYFGAAQEIYLVQSYDILTIQPLTAFLRDLKSRNILNPEKLRIVLNKVLRVRSITERMIIGGMAYYNDPAMSFMTELFNKDTIKYCMIPFEEQTYSRYLEGLVNCKISTTGYSRDFLISLEKLANMVYPLLGSVPSNGRYGSYNNPNEFSSNMNATLDRMKNSY